MEGKGRKTTCITIRLEDSIVQSLREKALKAGLSTPGEYVKQQIVKSFHSGITTKPTIPELQAMINEKQSKPTVVESLPPYYNSEVHTTGDTVRMKDPRTGTIKTVTL